MKTLLALSLFTFAACATQPEQATNDFGDAIAMATADDHGVDAMLVDLAEQPLAALHYDRSRRTATLDLGHASTTLPLAKLEPAQANELLYESWRFARDRATPAGTSHITCEVSYTCDTFDLSGYACEACVYIGGDCSTALNIGCHMTQ
jgi:hypothetical protein